MGSEISRPQQNGAGGSRRYGQGSKRVNRRMSMGAGLPNKAHPPSIRIGGSTGFLPDEQNEANEQPGEPTAQYLNQSRLSLSTDQLTGTNGQRSRSGSSSSQSPNKQPKSHRSSVSVKQRQLIQSCFNNPHENIGIRILKRSAERRKDFGRFYLTITIEQREKIADTLKGLLKKSVACIDSTSDDELITLAVEFGQKFVEYRLHGFKADYFAVLADSTITECVLLDAAVHPAAVTLNAFSQFITMLFSAVRDGFYNEMRRLRRVSNSFSTTSNEAISVRKKLSAEGQIKPTKNGIVGSGNRSSDISPRSLSPSAADDKSINTSPSAQGSQEEIGCTAIAEEIDTNNINVCIEDHPQQQQQNGRQKSPPAAIADKNNGTIKTEERIMRSGKENQQQMIKQPQRPQQRQLSAAK